MARVAELWLCEWRYQKWRWHLHQATICRSGQRGSMIAGTQNSMIFWIKLNELYNMVVNFSNIALVFSSVHQQTERSQFIETRPLVSVLEWTSAQKKIPKCPFQYVFVWTANVRTHVLRTLMNDEFANFDLKNEGNKTVVDLCLAITVEIESAFFVTQRKNIWNVKKMLRLQKGVKSQIWYNLPAAIERIFDALSKDYSGKVLSAYRSVRRY